MRAQHYDLVLNGFELGSGSIRIHNPEFQHRIFRDVFGLSEADIADRFGFFMEALRYGAPPHGGMAWGIDRVAMLACGETLDPRRHRVSEKSDGARPDDGRAEQRTARVAPRSRHRAEGSPPAQAASAAPES